jgi:MFS family permease
MIAGFVVGNVANKFGKKKTAFVSLIIGSLVLIYMTLFSNFLIVTGMAFLAACFIAISWPSINGAYADYISETIKYEKEIEGIEDFATNFGYTIGPMLAGFLADRVGNIPSFAFLGFAGIIVGLVLFKITPKEIKVIVRSNN